jgi:hypothetical protein
VDRLFATLACAVLLAATAAEASPCPGAGGALTMTLDTVETGAPETVRLTGTLIEPSCDDATSALAATYEVSLACDPARPDTCSATLGALRPGRWRHHIEGTQGPTAARRQARQSLILDATAGTHALRWPAVRSVITVGTLDDALACTDCLRAALLAANLADPPALVQFAPGLAGTITLAAALPEVSGSDITIDGFDREGIPLTRTIDANGLNYAALRITGARNTVAGLRVANSGGDSDTLLIAGPEANGNLIDTVAVLGRAVAPCQVGTARGCLLDGVCVVPGPDMPRGACGDDGIAVREFAGAAAANVVRNADVRGAFDKGIKGSDDGVVRVEHSVVLGNADGGIQATLSGTVTATANVVAFNRGTATANGIAANGARAGSTIAARLETRGNLVLGNALRGISVRGLSLATLRDDFACGNGTVGRDNGMGLGVFDAAGSAAAADAGGLALLHNVGAGAVVGNTSTADFGNTARSGHNAFAFNGAPDPATPANFRNDTEHALTAAGNQWEHCGAAIPCDLPQVRARDVFRATLTSSVAVSPGLPTAPRAAPRITAIEPPYAAAGELVRIYGSGFDAIEGAGSDCGDIAAANTCRPVRGNCVFVDRQAAEVVAVTPTMLVIRAPFTCVAPVELATRSRRSRGFGRATFCTTAAPS